LASAPRPALLQSCLPLTRLLLLGRPGGQPLTNSEVALAMAVLVSETSQAVALLTGLAAVSVTGWAAVSASTMQCKQVKPRSEVASPAMVLLTRLLVASELVGSATGQGVALATGRMVASETGKITCSSRRHQVGLALLEASQHAALARPTCRPHRALDSPAQAASTPRRLPLWSPPSGGLPACGWPRRTNS